MKCLRAFCIAAGILARMNDLSIPLLVAEFFRHDPFRALGLMCLACVAISMTTNFDVLELLGFVDVPEQDERTTSVV